MFTAHKELPLWLLSLSVSTKSFAWILIGQKILSIGTLHTGSHKIEKEEKIRSTKTPKGKTNKKFRNCERYWPAGGFCNKSARRQRQAKSFAMWVVHEDGLTMGAEIYFMRLCIRCQ